MSNRLGEIKARQADGYETACRRNVGEAAILMLNDIRYLLSLLDRPVCKWTERGKGVCYWTTSCHHDFTDDSGLPDFKWCGYCGGTLEEVIPEDKQP